MKFQVATLVFSSVISSVGLSAKVVGSTDPGHCYGEPLANGICNRNPIIIDALLEHFHKSDCAKVTKEDLCTVTDFHLKLPENEFNYGNFLLQSIKKEDLEGMYKLRRLVMMFVGIKDIAPDAFEGLRKPQADDCYPYNPNEASTGLRGKAKAKGYAEFHEGRLNYPTAIDQESCLGILDFSHNIINLGTLAEGVFAPLSNLEIFEIDSNPQYPTKDKEKHVKTPLWRAKAGVFAGLKSLTDLDIDGSGLYAIEAGFLSDSPKLQGLDLKDNQLRDIPDDLLSIISSNNGTAEISNNPSIPSSRIQQMKSTFGDQTVDNKNYTK